MKIWTYIRVINNKGKVKIYGVQGSGDLRKAAYCYEIGDDFYESGDRKVKKHTEILEKDPEDCDVTDRIFVNEGKVE